MNRYVKALEESRKIMERERAERPVLVFMARALGASWTEIGTALGMSRQGALQQFGTVKERAVPKGQSTIDDVLE
jgi:hypothetical protein